MSNSTPSILKQSAAGPSTIVTSPSEKTPQAGPSYVDTNTTGVAHEETATPLNPVQTHVKIDDGLTSVSLWDTAYDGLKEEEETRKLLSAYEDLLSRVPIKGTAIILNSCLDKANNRI